MESIIENCHVQGDHGDYVEGAFVGWTSLELISKYAVAF